MKFNNMKNKSWYPYAVALCIGVILYVALTNLAGIGGGIRQFFKYIAPVTIGAVIAYIINPLVVFMQKKVFKKIKKESVSYMLSVVLSIVIVLLILIIISALLIPQLIESITTFAKNINGYADNLQNVLDVINDKIPSVNLNVDTLVDSITNLMADLASRIPELLSKASTISAGVANFGSNLFNAVLGIILAIYFIIDKKRIVKFIKQLVRLIMGNKRYEKFAGFLERCNDIMVQYIVCELIEAFIVGGVNLIFMLIMRMPYAVLISVIVGITNMIPSFGPIIGAVIGGFILLLVSPIKALWFIIFTLILQTFDGYILKPKMYGSSLGVPSVLILTFIIVGGKMFGIAGILLAIPVAAIISFTYIDLILPRLKKWRNEE